MRARSADKSAPVRSGRIFGSVLNELQQRLRQGEWQPGEHLPSITHLATEFAVSTGSVREALRSLQSQGLVRIEHGRGVIVISNSFEEATFGTDVSVSMDHMTAFAEARRLIEPELAAYAAERGSDTELAEILQLALTMEQQAVSGLDFVGPDIAFHRAIAQASHNPVLRQMLHGMHDLFIISRRLTSQELGMTERAVRYHRLIAEAIYERNATQARLLMLAHMNDALSSVLAMEAHMQRNLVV